MQGVRDFAMWIVPIIVLLVAVFVFNVPLWFAVPLALVILGALYFLLNPRSAARETQEETRLETEQLLRQTRGNVDRMNKLAPHIVKPSVREQVLKLSAMSDSILREMLSKPGASLLTANRLNSVFGQASDILDFYVQLNEGRVMTTPEKRAALSAQIENNVLPQLQASVHDFAAQQDRGEVASLEAAMRVLENTLKLEGIG